MEIKLTEDELASAVTLYLVKNNLFSDIEKVSMKFICEPPKSFGPFTCGKAKIYAIVKPVQT